MKSSEILAFWRMKIEKFLTKKWSSEILADENRKMFREKVKFRKLSTEFEIFLEIGGNLEQREEMHHGLYVHGTHQ